MDGNAKSFNALAAQSNQFAADKRIKRAIFSGITLSKDGLVSFTMSAELDSKLVVENPSSTAPSATMNTPVQTAQPAPQAQPILPTQPLPAASTSAPQATSLLQKQAPTPRGATASTTKTTSALHSTPGTQ